MGNYTKSIVVDTLRKIPRTRNLRINDRRAINYRRFNIQQDKNNLTLTVFYMRINGIKPMKDSENTASAETGGFMSRTSVCSFKVTRTLAMIPINRVTAKRDDITGKLFNRLYD